MSRIHVYTVHINPSLPSPYEEAKFVEEGFNWKAFIFSGLWALYHKLWLPALLMFAVSFGIIVLAPDMTAPQSVVCIQLAWHLIIGYMGNDWLRKGLRKRGFVTADIVTGDSLLRAEQRFFDRYFASGSQTPALAS